MFIILSAVHILHYLFAIYTAGVHVRGNASNDASNPRPPPPDPCMHFFSKLVTSLIVMYYRRKNTFDGWPCHTIFEVVVH